VPALMDFLDTLHQGVREVVVPKESVTEPLVPPWKRSEINLPTSETIASCRNGQYHVHGLRNAAGLIEEREAGGAPSAGT